MKDPTNINEYYGKLGTRPDVLDYQQAAIDAIDRQLAGDGTGPVLRMPPRGGGKSTLAAQIEAAAVKCGYTVVRPAGERYTMLFNPAQAEAVATSGNECLTELTAALDGLAADVFSLSPRQRRHYSFLMSSRFGKLNDESITHEQALAAAKEIPA